MNLPSWILAHLIFNLQSTEKVKIQRPLAGKKKKTGCY